MIIWGHKARERQVGSGNFFCPKCRVNEPYSLHRVSRYFTLYFIPLFPTSTLAEYVRCDNCGANLPAAVLRCTREELLQAMQPWVCSACRNHNPASADRCLACGAAHALQPPPIPLSPPPLKALPPTQATPAANDAGRCAACGMVRAHKSGCPNAPLTPPEFT